MPCVKIVYFEGITIKSGHPEAENTSDGRKD